VVTKLFSNDHDLYEKPKFTRLSSDEQEARFIADAVLKLKETISYKEISVLCRSSFHSNFVQAEFLKRNIPFVFVGGVQFIAKRHIKDILAYFKIIWNPFDKISWHRVLTILSGIGKVTANKIADEIHSANGELSPLQNSSYIRKNENIQLLYEILNNASNAHSLIKAFDIIEEYYIPILKKVEENWKTRIEDFKVLKRLCAEHNDFEKFLSNLALDPPKDNKLEYTAVDKKDDNKDFVTISTIHSAKGLEWNSVFVISLIDGAVPSNRSFNDYEQLEEERKLFYVACSRAKQNLYLTAPSYLTTYSGYFDNHSRFINEIDSTKYDYVEYTTL